MTRKKTTKTNAQETLLPEQAAKLLRNQYEKGREILANQPISSATAQAWDTVMHDLLIRSFGPDSPNISSIMGVGEYSMIIGEVDWEKERANNMTTKLEIVDGLIDSLESQAELSSETASTTPTAREKIAIGNKVFLVHGHDEELKQTVARTLTQLELEPIILHERPNRGQTIIEKIRARG